jgi:Holliday junction resolvase RusA-like endonuclease
MSTTITWPLRISVPDLPPSPNRRMCWQERRRIVKPMADAVVLQARAFALPEPLPRSHVVVTLVHTRRPLRDYDNATASIKELVDALITGGLIVDDCPECMELAVVQVLGRERGVTLEVSPAPERDNCPSQGRRNGSGTPAGVFFPTVEAWSSWYSAADTFRPGLPSRLLTVTCHRGHHEGRTVFFQEPSGWLDAAIIDQLLGLARPNRAKSRRRRRDRSQQGNKSWIMDARSKLDGCRCLGVHADG